MLYANPEGGFLLQDNITIWKYRYTAVNRKRVTTCL